MSEVCILLKLVLVAPATNAVSERSTSALRRVKTYLRSTMTQERLNHLLLLHVHTERTDSLRLETCLQEFIEKLNTVLLYLATFNPIFSGNLRLGVGYL